jgi:hypothetical protein
MRERSRHGYRVVRASKLSQELRRTDGPDAGAYTFQPWLSDHVRGRRLGGPTGHFASSLTPRDWVLATPLAVAAPGGGMERRPTAAASNLRDDLQLSGARPRASRVR